MKGIWAFLFPCFVSLGSLTSAQIPPLINGRTAALLKIYRDQVENKYPISQNPPDLTEEEKARIAEQDGTELSQNYRLFDELLEGDIVPTEDLLRDLIAEGGRRRKRKLTSRLDYRWESRWIPYTFEVPPSWSRNYISSFFTRDQIRKGLKGIEETTCLRFQERSYYEASSDSIHFFRGNGCYSNVGRRGGSQGVSIGDGCEKAGIVAHEVAHALGMWHEQSRPDRDQYLHINWANIQKGMQGNFERRQDKDVSSYQLPYDFGSVMHYGPKGFVFDFKFDSLESLDQQYQRTFGQREGLSFVDTKMLNYAYCNETCYYPLSCLHGGYADPNDCTRCRCPRGLGGTYCEKAQRSNQNCGGDLVAGDSWQTVTFGPLNPSQECYWHIKAPGNQRIDLEIQKLDYPQSYTCQSYLEIKSSNNFQSTGPRYCSDRDLNRRIISEGSEMLLIHYSNYKTKDFLGFTLRFKTEFGSGIEYTTRAPASRAPWRGRGNWSQWSEWSSCYYPTSDNCGTARRGRSCWDGVCDGKTEESVSCGACDERNPVEEGRNPEKDWKEGGWTGWSEWSMCYSLYNQPCGYRERARTCFYTTTCPGPEKKVELCGPGPECSPTPKPYEFRTSTPSPQTEPSTVGRVSTNTPPTLIPTSTTNMPTNSPETDGWFEFTEIMSSPEPMPSTETTRVQPTRPPYSEKPETTERLSLLQRIEKWIKCLGDTANDIIDNIKS